MEYARAHRRAHLRRAASAPEEEALPPPLPARGRSPLPLSTDELQRLAGNAAVARLVHDADGGMTAQRQGAADLLGGEGPAGADQPATTPTVFICTSEHEPEPCWSCVSADRTEEIRARRLLPFLPDPEFVPAGTVMTIARPAEAAAGGREEVESEITPEGGPGIGTGGAGAATPGGAAPGAGGGGAPVEVEAGSRMIRRGSVGPDVAALQDALNREGAEPALAADGIFGRRTDAAVRRFQASRGLAPDGIVGPLTWRALGFAPPVATGSTTAAGPEGTTPAGIGG